MSAKGFLSLFFLTFPSRLAAVSGGQSQQECGSKRLSPPVQLLGIKYASGSSSSRRCHVSGKSGSNSLVFDYDISGFSGSVAFQSLFSFMMKFRCNQQHAVDSCAAERAFSLV